MYYMTTMLTAAATGHFPVLRLCLLFSHVIKHFKVVSNCTECDSPLSILARERYSRRRAMEAAIVLKRWLE